MKQKIIAFFTIFLLLANIIIAPQVGARTKDDISGHYFEKDMRMLIAKGILGGYGNGIYRPDGPVTRAEFAQLVVKTLNLYPTEVAQYSLASTTVITFFDVTPDKWYYASIKAAVEAGIVGGYPDGTFQPNRKISRQEMAAIIMRALNLRGITSQKAPLTFKDKDKIGQSFIGVVQSVVYLGVMSGTGNNFNPRMDTSRGQAGAVLNRMINLITPSKNLPYKIVTFNRDGSLVLIKAFSTFQQAKNNVVGDQVVLQGDRIAYINSGMAVAGKVTVLYTDPTFKSHLTYVVTGTELEYVDATDAYVKVKIANLEGYVKIEEIKLIPIALQKGQSYFENKNGEMFHQVYNPLTNRYAEVHTGKAPSFMGIGQKYYSWDGVHFTTSNGKQIGTAYQYFNYLPLHTTTAYTAEELDKFLLKKYPSTFKQKIKDSPLVGVGKNLKALEAKYEVNALYLMANAIHESAWGTSDIAQDKHNLFGIGAIDSNPYKNAREFASFTDCLDYMARQIVANEYHNPNNWKYHGSVLGNKAVGMNVRYASDPYWGEKIAGHMYRADQYLGGKDFARYSLAVTNIANLNVRPGYGTGSGESIFAIKPIGIPLIFSGKETHEGATWYEIRTDSTNKRTGYVYGNGTLGEYIKEIQIMR